MRSARRIFWKWRVLANVAQRYRSGLKVGAAWLCVAALALGFAATDFDRMQMLAQQQYGAGALQTVVAWRKLIDDSSALAENHWNSWGMEQVTVKTS